MRVNRKTLLSASAGLAISLATLGCASHRTTASTTSPTATRVPRTDQTTEVTPTGEQVQRLQNASTAFQEIMSTPDKGIPQDLLDRSQCVVIIPHMKKAAFVIGAEYGKGYMSCRTANGQGWTSPATVRMEGGSLGFQIGGEEVDIVLLVMNKQGENRLLQDQFQIGADASVAAGPVGREASASTDALATAEMLAYSRSRGLFGGVSLMGTTIREDKEDNQILYGRPYSTRDIMETNPPAPAAAQQFISTLKRFSPAQKASGNV